MNTEGRRLLQALCKLIHSIALDSTTHNAEEFTLGLEAETFMSELAAFVSDIQQKKRNKGMEVALDDTAEDALSEMTLCVSSSQQPEVKRAPEIQEYRYMDTEEAGDTDVMTVTSLNYEDTWLFQHFRMQDLHERISNMPLRLLCCEYPANDHDDSKKMRISLLDHNEVYEHLAAKIQLDNSDVFSVSDYTRYAILSHTWSHTPGEVTYNEWETGSLDADNPKCQKLINFCRTALDNHGISLTWIDTVCINKESSSELDESIRSMYKWYANAAVCITHLSETGTFSEMEDDRWFTRGWTLQELIAPPIMKFYSRKWEPIFPYVENDKKTASVLRAIHRKTTITEYELHNIRRVSISRRMELAAQRNVTREEDAAYALMGMFNVSISTAYGEGFESAFFRLLKEIFNSTKEVCDIFNWGGIPHFRTRMTTAMFPCSHSSYLHRSIHENLRPWLPIEPFTLTHLGLRTPILLVPAVLDSPSKSQDISAYYGTVCVEESLTPSTYSLFSKDAFNRHKIGILNVEDQCGGESICIPRTCFAVLLRVESDGRYKKVDTWRPVIFTLLKRGSEGQEYYIVERNQLGTDGLELTTLYL